MFHCRYFVVSGFTVFGSALFPESHHFQGAESTDRCRDLETSGVRGQADKSGLPDFANRIFVPGLPLWDFVTSLHIKKHGESLKFALAAKMRHHCRWHFFIVRLPCVPERWVRRRA
jgi:hypothetical protein